MDIVDSPPIGLGFGWLHQIFDLHGEPAVNSYSISRFAIAFIWLYHGLIPKLIFQHATELELINKGPVIGSAELTLLLAGIGEVLAGVCVLVFWNRIWPVYLSLFGFTALLIASIAISPGHAVHAFNPITLTMSAIFFCLIQLSQSTAAKLS